MAKIRASIEVEIDTETGSITVPDDSGLQLLSKVTALVAPVAMAALPALIKGIKELPPLPLPKVGFFK